MTAAGIGPLIAWRRSPLESLKRAFLVPTIAGVALINIGADGQNSIVVVPGANGDMRPADIRKNAPLLRRAGMIMAQLETPLEALEALGAFAHKLKITFMLDPAPARALKDCSRHCEPSPASVALISLRCRPRG